ncbi:signal peptidase [Palleronia sediminis]|uniref:Signal peptidase n=1 Tax=Palleronia sediminis TaxID=2547833 RepID=A0A4R6AF72_9RHOB|nr:imelysin family protein [Palleronia sediminis]TDL81634.1 signal peptidase [Palleronia sediminis]
MRYLPTVLAAFALGALTAGPLAADVDAALDEHVLPRMERLAEATATLADAPCEADALRPAFAGAAAAWAGVSHLTLGPAEESGRARAVLFWPDERDSTARGLRLLEQQGPEAWTPEAIARASVAARGLGALERLIFERDAAPCALTLALADDLAATAAAIRDGWTGGFADLMRDPGGPGNTRFLTAGEAEAALFTSLMTGLELVADQRLGRPLGSFDDPRPRAAELWRAGVSQAMVVESLTALRELAGLLAPAPRTTAALDAAIAQAARLDDPAFAGVADPSGRFRVEALQTAVCEARNIAGDEIGGALGVRAGFNSADGD